MWLCILWSFQFLATKVKTASTCVELSKSVSNDLAMAGTAGTWHRPNLCFQHMLAADKLRHHLVHLLQRPKAVPLCRCAVPGIFRSKQKTLLCFRQCRQCRQCISAHNKACVCCFIFMFSFRVYFVRKLIAIPNLLKSFSFEGRHGKACSSESISDESLDMPK